ncbi:single-pass membrane and coiled-coil domain-containing protein 4 [Takifugu flavidus]|uniref:single-pass membrane and coiled-coil domain-containing protein 4 n=1 Tax=Takifugu flavidus TaxID=433684 RepID=UPI002544A83A|nr:single-pass membrane and coiled-coil domain-containing protein 4 [Takifugu flavidus]
MLSSMADRRPSVYLQGCSGSSPAVTPANFRWCPARLVRLLADCHVELGEEAQKLGQSRAATRLVSGAAENRRHCPAQLSRTTPSDQPNLARKRLLSGRRHRIPEPRLSSEDVMRQLKGKPKKETSKDKRERKQAMQDARKQVATVVLPTVAVVVLLIVFFVYAATRPGAIA